MGAALVANICLIIRFLEKRVKQMTIIALCLLSVHGSSFDFYAEDLRQFDFIPHRRNQCSYCHRVWCRAQIQRRIYVWTALLVGGSLHGVRISIVVRVIPFILMIFLQGVVVYYINLGLGPYNHT